MSESIEEQVNKLYEDASPKMDYKTFKIFKGEINHGLSLEIPADAHMCYVFNNIQDNLMASIFNCHMKEGRNYEILVCVKDVGPYDSSYEADQRRAKEVEAYAKKDKELSDKAHEIRSKKNLTFILPPKLMEPE